MQKYGKFDHIFGWLILLCCMVIMGCDNIYKVVGCLEDERIALLNIKDVMTHQNRSVHFTWGDEQIQDCCKWEGVTCDYGFSKRILNLSIIIDFDNIHTRDENVFLDASLFQPFEELQNLTIHDYMFQGFKGRLRLKKLQVLDLSNNDMSHVPLMGELPSLKFLDLSRNYGISKNYQELTNLSSLEHLNLGINGYPDVPGPIPPSIWTLTSLKWLGLERTYINGSLPEGLCTLTSLEELDLSYNELEGVFPKCLNNLTSLKFLHLSGNQLSNDIQGLMNLSSLELLNLGSNNIEGPIPPIIWSLTTLKMLGLSENRINGSLPEGLCTLTSLEELDLSYNAFEGVLPTLCLSNLTSLRLLDLSRNKFSGSIPSNLFSGLKSLQYVSLSQNLFDGLFSFNSLEDNSKIEVFQLENDNPMLKVETENLKWKHPFSQLKIFVLSNCILNEPSRGIIPSFLLTQYDLRVVKLNNNGMNGELPNWLLANNSRLQELTLRNNSFNGPLLLQLGSYNAYMRRFDISMNQVSGEIPTFIGSIFPNLYYLDMSTNAIEGTIPHLIENMRELTVLDLSNNHIYGEIPRDLFYRCEKLVFLKLSNNNLSDFLPMKSSKLQLASLQLLDISNNSFIGRFPDLITEFSFLIVLDLSKNHFEGKLPASLCNLNELEILDLSWNNFVDTLPPCTDLPFLTYLYLQGNRFHGLLPIFLSKSSSLTILDVSSNKFSGLIPAWIGSFRALTFLLLRGNIFHGSIPSQLCHLENLNILDLAANNITGYVPPCLFHIPIGKSTLTGMGDFLGPEYQLFEPDTSISYETKLPKAYEDVDTELLSSDAYVQIFTKHMYRSYKLYYDPHSRLFLNDIRYFMSAIDLSLNKLTGPIPVDIDNWDNVHSLNLSNNHLNGSIPWTLSRIKILESLDLSHNMLSGKIPSELTKLTSLGVFSVAYNNLSGPTPTRSNQFGTFESVSYEGNPLLCGPPLDKNCSSGPTIMPHVKPSVEPEQNDSPFKTQFLWSFFGSFVMSSIGAFVFFYFCTNVPQMFLTWIGIEENVPRRRTVELPWKMNI